MLEKDLKKVTVEVSNDCWKKLKILSIQKEISLTQCVRDLLERSMGKKNINEIQVLD